MGQADGESYFEQLCQHIGVAVIATDADLNIRTWNAAAARTFGAAADRMIGTPVVQIIPQERRRVAERMLRRAMDTGETIQLEFQHRNTQGDMRELAGTIAPVVSASGERIGASICVRDITRRIELQGELHESRKMVALGEMAGAIAHHFNNILGGAVTSIDYALTSDDPSLQRRVFEQVAPALQRATTLVNGLLAFAQGDRRTDEQVDLTILLQQFSKWIEQTIEGHNIDLSMNVPRLSTFPVPSGPVTTILENIAQNAVEAMPDGGNLGVDVTLGSESVMILITDTGCGLDESTKSRIFEPFWSTKSVLQEGAGESMGLGLAIAHGLVQMIGGSISVSSTKGEGSSFRVTFPRPKNC